MKRPLLEIRSEGKKMFEEMFLLIKRGQRESERYKMFKYQLEKLRKEAWDLYSKRL